MEDKNNARAIALINMIADSQIAIDQLSKNNKDLTTKYLLKDGQLADLKVDFRVIEEKVRLASAKLEYMLAKFGLSEHMKIEREDIQEIFDILTKKGDE